MRPVASMATKASLAVWMTWRTCSSLALSACRPRLQAPSGQALTCVRRCGLGDAPERGRAFGVVEVPDAGRAHAPGLVGDVEVADGPARVATDLVEGGAGGGLEALCLVGRHR